jgi:2-dehydro-3-deoxy-D-arabinonate dehydratase
MSLIVRYAEPGGRVRVGVLTGAEVRQVDVNDLGALLALGLDQLRLRVEAAADGPVVADVELLAPVDHQEVWAAGVTYRRSRDARLEESGGLDVYARVYDHPRPELFLKAPGWRAIGPGGRIGVRRDATWSVPEPEVVVVVNSGGEVVGFTAGNDVSSRDIEGENPLYLPQAKVYEASCQIGPGIRPVWELEDQPVLGVRLTVERAGESLFSGETSTTQMVRTFGELVGWLFAALAFPQGVLLMTGTGIVPPSDVTLQDGDVVVVEVGDVGELRGTVSLVGAASSASRAP